VARDPRAPARQATAAAQFTARAGDKYPGDSQLNTFNPLFPKGKYFGEAGLLGPHNRINLQPSLDLTLTDQWSLGFASVFYWRESTGDGIYDNGGTLLRPDGGSDARYIGTQLDVVLTYAPRRGLDTTFRYSTFLPGAFIDATGPSETVHFLSAELRYWF
jgi:hypothetical protein